MLKKLAMLCCVAVIAAGAVPAQAQLTVPSDGSDGVFLPTGGGDVVIDLSLAATLCDCDGDGVVAETCRWDCPSPVIGNGVYDPEKWAIVYKFAPQFGNQEFAVDIPVGTRIFFKIHPSNAPVVWLVNGKVRINGEVFLDGAIGTGSSGVFSIPAPGGFRGGGGKLQRGVSATAGLGPGGGNYSAAGDGHPGGAGYASQGAGVDGSFGLSYGNARILPLIGGSGGAGRQDGTAFNDGGGAGGGAILIVASEEIVLGGFIHANGNKSNSHGGHGAGGAIRLVSDRVSGAGLLEALGFKNGRRDGSDGRIRVEANVVALLNTSKPPFSVGLPGDPPMVWPPDTAPRITPMTLGGVPIPVDPRAKFAFPLQDVSLSSAGLALLEIQATNLPTTSSMMVRIVPEHGGAVSRLPAIFISGDDLSSTWNAFCSLKNGVSDIQVRATLP